MPTVHPDHPAIARRPALLALFTLLVASACGGGGTTAEAPPPEQPEPWTWTLPAGFAPPVVPADNPMNAAKVELGRHLFHDTRLSVNNTLACAGCHAVGLAFADGRAVARGATGQNHPRNAPGLVNAAYQTTLDWANPASRTLEQQMHTPLFGEAPIEMGVNDANRAAILQRLQSDADYPARFASAFGGESAPLHWDNVIKAIAAFERTLISAGSRYDQALAGTLTLSNSEQRGQALFFGQRGAAHCVQCHAGPNLGGGAFVSSEGSVGASGFYNIGLFNIGDTGAYPVGNQGLIEFTGQPADMGRFRAPSLRNVALTAPYLHDGSAATLEAVVALHAAGGRVYGPGPYAGDGRANPYKEPLIDQIAINAEEQADLVAFLQALTDPGIAEQPGFADPFAK
ncbi:MAG TPA: di-heme enzyme [Ottowia sp.]|uniref:MbnH family di-heme enzyme n=1 Tax=Ottowia sp. TaxID=1898956 RepID=UPI002B8FD53E|nr:MbnH family di-heme enzyme [Ottowia sp.]HMN21587.1 di-heme enzyme [Ottowia sp.]